NNTVQVIPDLVAVKIWTANIQYLVFSIYIPPITLLQPTHDSSAQQLLDTIQTTIEEHSNSTHRTTKLILAGDLNRHHPAWNHQPIAPRLIEHADELINFFQTHRLQWCLPRGTPTYWALHNPGQSSTIDLTVTDDSARLIRCQLYHDNYGSDHRGTLSEWDLQPRRNKPSIPKRAYDRANWEKIGQDIQSQTTTLPTILSTTVTTADLDQAVEKLISSTVAALDRHIPRHRPSPYAKWWLSPALKVQQIEVNQARRRWQSSCADLGL
ncbi:reverse transcriptase, partial [Aspergillus luchuensis IFO 4308]